MKNLSVRIKYSIPAFFLVLALIIDSLIYSSLVSNLENKLGLFSDKFIAATEVVINADRDLHQARIGEMNFILAETDKARKKAQKYYDKNARQAKERFEKYRTLMEDYPSVTSSQSGFDDVYQVWYEKSSMTFSLVKQGKEDEAKANLSSASYKSFKALGDLYDYGRDGISEKLKEISQQIKDEIDSKRAVTMLISALVIIFSILISFILLNQLKKRLNQVSTKIHDITEGDGDLTKTIEVDSKDELGQLAVEFNAFVKSLSEKVAVIKVNADSLNGESSGLLSSANDSNQAASGLSSSSEQIVTAIYQLSQSIKEMTDGAHSTATNTKDASQLTSDSISSVDDSVQQIKELESNSIKAGEAANKLAQSSTDISSVVDVIRGIADQTNLLALNAAIEAARAGEQGRGFAVVADEVRSLANKTQESTDSIQGMIESLQVGVDEVVNDVETGRSKVSEVIALSDAAKNSLNEVNEIISKIELMSQQTATATEEQSYAVEEINKNVHALNDKAQVLLDVSSTTSQASGNITDLTSKINHSVDVFKVGAFKK